MSQKIDPTGFPKGVWGVVLEYTAPSTRDAIVYTVNRRPSEVFDRVYNLKGSPHELVHFVYPQIKQMLTNYFEFGQYYDLPKVDQQIRMFAMTTFVIGFGGGLGVLDKQMNLRNSVIDNLNMGFELIEGGRSLNAILQQLGLIGDRGQVPQVAFAVSSDRYFALPQPDEPKEPVKLEERDVTVEDLTPKQP